MNIEKFVTELLSELNINSYNLWNYNKNLEDQKIKLITKLKSLIDNNIYHFTIEEIIDYCINNFNNLNLINQNEAPNANLIYIFWNDGEITYEKGSWAFGQRSVFPIEYAFIHDNKPIFPFKRNSYTGIITTQERCYFLRFLYEIKLQKIF